MEKYNRIQFISRLVIFSLFFFFVVYSGIALATTSISVKTFGELQMAVSNAKGGDIITMEDGIFSGESLQISCNGFSGKPITIQAKNTGKANITFPVKINGDFIVFQGIRFSEKGNLEISGRNCRVSRCTWNDAQSGKWLRVAPGSAEIEIDHNLFENKTNNREMDRNCQLIQIVVRNENESHHIHHNLFREIPKGKTGNGFETLQLITENNPFDPPGGPSNSIIEDNLFIHCDGESEIISVKSNGNIIRRNTFRACEGSLVLRHGDNNVATANIFFGEGVKGSGGVRLQGTGQIVANNYFQDLDQLSLGMMDGTPDDLYIRVERAKVLFNTFVNCKKTFVIGLNHSSHPNGTVPKDCRIAGNLFYYNDENRPEAIVELVQNDQPENWTWNDNFAFGATEPPVAGIRIANPHLEFLKNGLAFPTDKTPQVEVQLPSSEQVKIDLLGEVWKTKRTVGAIQYPANRTSKSFLTEKEVGPEAP